MPKTTGSLEGLEVPDRGPAPTPSDVIRIDGAVWQVNALIWIALAALGALLAIAIELWIVHRDLGALLRK